jgi:hypothetical protein|nr:hypothetical protein [Bradyrhizobium diazoefficiens]
MERAMAYTIGFRLRDDAGSSAVQAATANQAIAIVAALMERVDEITLISSAQEGEMGVEMLLLLAKEEAEEMPQRA